MLGKILANSQETLRHSGIRRIARKNGLASAYGDIVIKKEPPERPTCANHSHSSPNDRSC